MALSEADIYVIKRLSSRVNVLPVISRADTMTNERLEEVKAAIRRDLKKGGVQVGNILGQLDSSESEEEDEEDEDNGEDEEETRAPRTVVRIRTTRGTSDNTRGHPLFNKRSRSRTRAALTDEDVDFELASIVFPKGVHSMRALFPFSIMSPDPVPMRGGPGSTNTNGNGAVGVADGSPAPPSSYRRRSVFLDSGDHLKALRGRYTRNYRWGSVDVLSEFPEARLVNSFYLSVMLRAQIPNIATSWPCDTP